MIDDRSVLILYSTAVCNLKCTYCFIDKNPALIQIDKLLAESFKDDYYFNFCKKVFPDPSQLEEIQIWGGEPTLDFHRITPVIKKIVEYYPNLHTLMFSTNLAHDECLSEIYYLLHNIPKEREITLNLQLSLDGPTFITDANRGKGTTEKFTKNFIKLISTIDNFLDDHPNIVINAFNKSTLNIDNILSLQTEQAIIDYYKFIEKFKGLCNKILIKNSRFNFEPSIPNTAAPLPITVEVGKKFANLCALCRKIEKDNQDNQIFDYFSVITPYATDRDSDKCFCNKGACGSGKYCIGLLPNNLISTCHNGFTALLEEYKKYALLNNTTNLQENFFESGFARNSMVFDYAELSNYENQIEEFYKENSANQISALVGQIQFLAITKQIDSKYTTLKNAIDAAYFISTHGVNCIRDNINITGTKLLVPANLLKLTLNGAKEYIENDR